MNTVQRTYNENEWSEVHESLKASGATIIRCVEISGAAGSEGLKQYKVTFLATTPVEST